jgi:uncharacterized protein (TIGR03437 family)
MLCREKISCDFLIFRAASAGNEVGENQAGRRVRHESSHLVVHACIAAEQPMIVVALWSLSGDGRGPGAIQHASTCQVVSVDNPALAGEILAIYCTGLLDGAAIPPQVSIGGRMAQVLWFGNVPGYAGLNQINARVPDRVLAGSAVPVRINYIGRLSNEVTIGMRQ